MLFSSKLPNGAADDETSEISVDDRDPVAFDELRLPRVTDRQEEVRLCYSNESSSRKAIAKLAVPRAGAARSAAKL